MAAAETHEDLPPIDLYEDDIAHYTAESERIQATQRVTVAAAKALRTAEKQEKEDERRAQLIGRLRAGGDAIFSVPSEPEGLWGEGQQSLWARGESLIIAGPSGVGKTTLMQQVVLARCGVGEPNVLGMPVKAPARVLYLALDRPRQILRSMQRMVREEHRDLLNENLVVWEGPLPEPVTKNPLILRQLAEECGAEAIFVDSLKDVVYDLEKPESSAVYNAARQHCLAANIDIGEIHHTRKRSSTNGKPNKLDDLFGGGWLTAGAGSVVMIWGEAGDEVVEFSHLKQVAERLGPWKLEHDHTKGRTKLVGKVDILELLAVSSNGLTVRSVASALSNALNPTDADQARAKRALRKLVDNGKVVVEKGIVGGAAGSSGNLYKLAPGVTVELSETHANRMKPTHEANNSPF
jgi:replicative DNA helicase